MQAHNRRVAYQHYEVQSDGQACVDVRYMPHLKAWVAAARWDRFLYSDPLPRKKDAVACALTMIATFGKLQ